MFTYKANGGLYVFGGVLLFIIFIFTGMRYVISDNYQIIYLLSQWYFIPILVDFSNQRARIY